MATDADRDELVRLLRSLVGPTPAGCLVLLATFVRRHLSDLENELRRRGEFPYELAGLPARRWDRRVLAATTRELGRLTGEDVLVHAARWLVALDRSLGAHGGQVLAHTGVHAGLDNREYVVRQRNAYFADVLEAKGDPVTWAGIQSRSIGAYLRRTIIVPVAASADGIRVESVLLSDRARPVDHRLLYERDRFVAVLAPLGRIELAEEIGEFVSLREPANVEAVAAEAEAAITFAESARATLLLLPELYASPTVLERIRRALEDHGAAGYPMLTVVGLAHQPDVEGELDLNECVMLGPDGTELHRHRKLTSFSTIGPRGRVGERLRVGETVTVIESSLGNLSLLICLDVLADAVKSVLRGAHASLLLVPSLSEDTEAHGRSANDLAINALATMFVCNRSLDGVHHAESASLWRVPGRGEHRDPGSAPYFEFHWEQLVSKVLDK